MRLSIVAELDYRLAEPADVLLALEVVQLPDQRLIEDLLTVAGATSALNPIPGEHGIGRRTWLTAHGRLHARYTAEVEIERAAVDFASLAADPLTGLPADVVPYIWPSRYCESDRFESFVERRFGGLAGGVKVAAMADWIHREMAYAPGASDTSTTAADAFVSRRGVCRDYAHLLATFARAAGIPARLVSAYAFGLDPPDFHALVEVWLAGGWHLADATGLAPLAGIVRIAAGRDATDVAFMTSFGPAEFVAQRVTVTRLA